MQGNTGNPHSNTVYIFTPAAFQLWALRQMYKNQYLFSTSGVIVISLLIGISYGAIQFKGRLFDLENGFKTTRSQLKELRTAIVEAKSGLQENGSIVEDLEN